MAVRINSEYLGGWDQNPHEDIMQQRWEISNVISQGWLAVYAKWG